jgi:hypothetical protein
VLRRNDSRVARPVEPAEIGLPQRRGHRKPTWRREELAGISVENIVRLEQGRTSGSSAQTAGALARALPLSWQERDHL